MSSAMMINIELKYCYCDLLLILGYYHQCCKNQVKIPIIISVIIFINPVFLYDYK